MSGEALRALWRKAIKEPVVEGRANAVQRLVYRALGGTVTRYKGLAGAADLTDLALWIMYHPECGVLPCEGWRLLHPPKLPPSELDALRTRYAADQQAVRVRLHLESVPLDATVSRPPAALAPNLRVAIHVHAFYAEELSRILSSLARLTFPFDLFISIPEGSAIPHPSSLIPHPSSLIPHPFSHLPHPFSTARCPNRGRDLAPLICTFGEALRGYDVIGHFHTKRSPQVSGGDWLGQILSELLPNDAQVRAILGLLTSGYGMVAPSDGIENPDDPTGWRHNLPIAEALARKAGWSLDLRRDFTPIDFPKGSMFWARGDYLDKLLALPVTFDDFPAEPIGSDGTLAHAIERLLFVLNPDARKMRLVP